MPRPTLLPAACVALAVLLGCGPGAATAAGDAGCVDCHRKTVQARVVHAAVHMGCSTCHGELDASRVPHGGSGAAGQAATAEPAALCAKCHEPALFEGKFVHGALLAAPCGACHDPHASAWQGLLKKEPARLCLDCHPEVVRRPHVVAGFARASHPIGLEGKAVPDPLRPGKTFYCAACHEPHRSATPRLTRVGRDTASCRRCHRM